MHIKGEAPEQLGHNDLLNSLVGQKSENVIRELGLPDQLLTDGSSHYMMYSAVSSGTQVGVVLVLPVYVGEVNDASLHCLRFKVDQNFYVNEYKTTSTWSWHGHSPDIDCRKGFWTIEERRNLKIETFSNEWREIELENLGHKEAKEAITE